MKSRIDLAQAEVAKIGADAFLAVVHCVKERGRAVDEGRPPSAGVISLGSVLNLHDPGAKVSQDDARVRCRRLCPISTTQMSSSGSPRVLRCSVMVMPVTVSRYLK